MKEMTTAATNMMSDEEKAEIERQLNQQYQASKNPDGTPQHLSAEAHAEPSSSSTPQPPTAGAGATATGAAASSSPPPSSSIPTPTPTPLNGEMSHADQSTAAATAATATATAAADKAQLREKHRLQREKLREQEEQRRKVMKERVKVLTDKLIERLRPYVEAKDPGNPNDQETRTWLAKLGKEAEDLKLESFGVELLHTIGHVYVMKGTTYLKSKKLLGM